MSRLLIGLVAGLGLAASALAPASAQAIPSGSYQQSCTNARVRGDQLTARCTNPQGVRVRSTIALNSCRGDIANSNGQLTCNSNGYGYGNGQRRHHNDGRDNGNGNNGYNNGGYNNGNSSYNNGRYNNGNNGGYNNGRYNNNGAAPGGSYQSSCTNVQMSGSTLSATCTSPNGGNITSSVNASRCRGMDIANLNGRLVCR